jgi:hypothetical protein
MVCLRNINVDTLHKRDSDNNNNNNNNNNYLRLAISTFQICYEIIILLVMQVLFFFKSFKIDLTEMGVFIRRADRSHFVGKVWNHDTSRDK